MVNLNMVALALTPFHKHHESEKVLITYLVTKQMVYLCVSVCVRSNREKERERNVHCITKTFN